MNAARLGYRDVLYHGRHPRLRPVPDARSEARRRQRASGQARGALSRQPPDPRVRVPGPRAGARPDPPDTARFRAMAARACGGAPDADPAPRGEASVLVPLPLYSAARDPWRAGRGGRRRRAPPAPLQPRSAPRHRARAAARGVHPGPEHRGAGAGRHARRPRAGALRADSRPNGPQAGIASQQLLEPIAIELQAARARRASWRSARSGRRRDSRSSARGRAGWRCAGCRRLLQPGETCAARRRAGRAT